jgi:hypothetical protein
MKSRTQCGAIEEFTSEGSVMIAVLPIRQSTAIPCNDFHR